MLRRNTPLIPDSVHTPNRYRMAGSYFGVQPQTLRRRIISC